MKCYDFISKLSIKLLLSSYLFVWVIYKLESVSIKVYGNIAIGFFSEWVEMIK